jgi:hypothetical protein
MKNLGKLTLIDGSEMDYELLPLTFNINKDQENIMVEFWQEQNKPYLTGIGCGSCPPVNSIFRFSQSIEI